MPFLPLDHPEPYFATLGVMLYPAIDEVDTPKARAYVAQVLARTFSRFREDGGNPPYDVLAPILMDAGEPLSDLQERWWGGRATGELFKTFFVLFNTDPRLASWENAIKIVDSTTNSSKVKGARTKLWKQEIAFYRSPIFGPPGQSAKGKLERCPRLGKSRMSISSLSWPRPRAFVNGVKHGERRVQRVRRPCHATRGARPKVGYHRELHPAGLKKSCFPSLRSPRIFL